MKNLLSLFSQRPPGPACICGAPLRPLVQHGKTTHREVDGIVSDIHHCKRCDHIQFAPLPSADWLCAHYGKSEFWDAAGLDPSIYIDIWRTDPAHIKFVELIRRAADSFPSPVRLHDFGCGHGGLVKTLREQGINATGSDLSTSTVEFGQKLGLPVNIGGIPDLLQIEPQHIITAYHSAEHILDPNAFLQAAVGALGPGGILLLAFPNGAYAPARVDSFDKFDWCFFPGHLHYYSPRSISAAFRRHGLEVVSMESNSLSEVGPQLDWLLSVMTGSDLETMDRALQSRDLRVAGRKPG